MGYFPTTPETHRLRRDDRLNKTKRLPTNAGEDALDFVVVDFLGSLARENPRSGRFDTSAIERWHSRRTSHSPCQICLRQIRRGRWFEKFQSGTGFTALPAACPAGLCTTVDLRSSGFSSLGTSTKNGKTRCGVFGPDSSGISS